MMSAKENNRVVFYSKHDSAWAHNLIRAEKLLDNEIQDDKLDLNDLLEFHHVKLYFDHNFYLDSWDDIMRNRYKELVKKKSEIARTFFLRISDENIIDYINLLEYRYKESFWDLIEYFQVYKKISTEVFVMTLNKFNWHITYILALKNTMRHYDNDIREFLMDYKDTAQLLMSKMEEKHRYDNEPRYFFPNSLTISDKEKIIEKYLDREDANLNYVNLILKSKDSKELKLSPKIRLKAKKKVVELNNEILKHGHSWKVGVEVAISKDQIEAVKYSSDTNTLKVCYSERYFNQLKNTLELFHVFSQLFDFIDRDGLITLVSKTAELDVLETIFMESKNEYKKGDTFFRKDCLSQLQLIIFDDYLSRRDISVEQIIEGYLNDFVKTNLNIGQLRFSFPSRSTSYVEKIRTLAPELDSLLKQYQLFVNDNEIDFELLELDSTPLRFSEISSLNRKKYAYAKGELFAKLKYIFFSSQSMMGFVKPYESKYDNLFALLTNEKVKFDDFENYQKDVINDMVSEKYLYIDPDNYVRIQKDIFLLIIAELNQTEVISYWNHEKFIRDVIDEMALDGMLYFENTLFTIPEQKYLNYYLNKKEFTNGLDLRNKYLHGTNSIVEREQKFDYYILLRIVVLFFLKIEDDLIINRYIVNSSIS